MAKVKAVPIKPKARASLISCLKKPTKKAIACQYQLVSCKSLRYSLEEVLRILLVRLLSRIQPIFDLQSPIGGT